MEFFLLDLLSTVIAVALGLPAGLWLNRQAHSAQKREQERDRKETLDSSIDTLIRSLRYNQRVLKEMEELAIQGRVMRSPDLQLTTWDVVGPILSPLCPKPELLQSLSHHWLRIQKLALLTEDLFAREVGLLPATEDSQIVRGTWQEMYDKCATLSNHADEIVERLQPVRSMPLIEETRTQPLEQPEESLLLGPQSPLLQADRLGDERSQEVQSKTRS